MSDKPLRRTSARLKSKSENQQEKAYSDPNEIQDTDKETLTKIDESLEGAQSREPQNDEIESRKNLSKDELDKLDLGYFKVQSAFEPKKGLQRSRPTSPQTQSQNQESQISSLQPNTPDSTPATSVEVDDQITVSSVDQTLTEQLTQNNPFQAIHSTLDHSLFPEQDDHAAGDKQNSEYNLAKEHNINHTNNLSQETSENDSEEEPIMALTISDVIKLDIPFFKGQESELRGFLNTCSMYHSMVPENLQGNLLTIIKAKIIGEAFNKLQPMNDYGTWALLEQALKTKIRKPVSYEYAHEQLTSIFQKPDETIESFGDRIKKSLRRLNEAARTVSDLQAELTAYRKTHEKLAISKFAQNIRDSSVKTLVMAANKNTLEDCITFAMEKELCEKNSNIKANVSKTNVQTINSSPCTVHKNSTHTENECRRNKSNDQTPPEREQTQQNTNQTSGNSPPPRTNQSSRSYRAFQPLTNIYPRSRLSYSSYEPRPRYNTYPRQQAFQFRRSYSSYDPRPRYYQPRQQAPDLQFQNLSLSNTQHSNANEQNQGQNLNNNSFRPYNQHQTMPRPNMASGSRSYYNNGNTGNNSRLNNNTRSDDNSRQMRPLTKEPSVEQLAEILETEESKN